MTRLLVAVILLLTMPNSYNLEGRWKMYEAEAFLNILTSKNFQLGSDIQQKQIAETFEFALANTYYTFQGDSVFFTDTGANRSIYQKNGKWLIQNDTLVIFESGKFKTHKFFIESLVDDELVMKIIFPTGEVSPSNMKFIKVE